MTRFRLQYISDIHLEFRTQIPKIPAKTNYLTLLGDIGHPNKPLYPEFLKYCSKNWDKVFLLSGNHEYLQKKYSMQEIDDMIRNVVSRHNNITFLNNQKLFIDNHLILGTTLWSDNTKTRPGHKINNLYQESVHFIEKNIKQHPDKDIVILSHYVPSYELILPKYHRYKSSFNYSSNLDYLIKKPVKAWLCGHSHCQLEKYINGVYCGINTLGYPHESILDNKNMIRMLEL